MYDALIIKSKCLYFCSGGNIVGKASCEYLCLSGSSWTSISGPTLNPLDVTRTAGGSSGGSVVLVCISCGVTSGN